MKINGRNLGWAIINLVIFIYLSFVDFEITTLSGALVNLFFIFLFMFLFINNMEKAFK